jgi:hypothetical protein
MSDKIIEVHVEKRTIYSVIITDKYGRHEIGLHSTPAVAVAHADRMLRKNLATKRGKDLL